MLFAKSVVRAMPGCVLCTKNNAKKRGFQAVEGLRMIWRGETGGVTLSLRHSLSARQSLTRNIGTLLLIEIGDGSLH